MIIKKLGTKPTVLQQDNTSSIRLEINVKRSSVKRTRHINIRYFYDIYKVRSVVVVIVHHLTGALVGDFLTKTLDGTPFKFHRDTTMGLDKELITYYKKRYENARDVYHKRI